jgi:hypothetical protein
MIELDTTDEGFIYLASPYSHDDPSVQFTRFIENSEVAARLFQEGVIVFAPIIQSPCMSHYGNLKDTDWDTWARFDKAIIAQSKGIYVINLPGWRESVGVTAEMHYARLKGIPCYLIDYKTLELTQL